MRKNGGVDFHAKWRGKKEQKVESDWIIEQRKGKEKKKGSSISNLIWQGPHTKQQISSAHFLL